MSLYLVRHASAGDRRAFVGDDFDRPLDERGLGQAARLVRHLADCPVRAVWSSVAVRCIDTVSPLASRHGLEVEIRDELTEGGPASTLMDLLRAEAAPDDDLVLCSHGDLIPEVLNHLQREGMAVVGARGCAKGSVWKLETRGHDIVRGVYIAKP